jgi:hypothetical protein
MRTCRGFSASEFVTRRLIAPYAVWLAAAAFIPSLCLAQPAKPPRELVAVLDLEPIDASKAEALALTDRLREELLRSGAVTLVDRGQLDAILNEQALQQSGCTSQECAVKVGRILGVRKIVAGRVNKVNAQTWLISVILVDAETAETLRAESAQHQGSYFDLMGAGMTKLAGQLFAPRPADPVAAAPRPTAPAPPQPLPQAEPPPPAVPAAVADTSGATRTQPMVYAGLAGGGALLLYALVEYQSAVSLNDDAKQAATTDPGKSKRLETQRDQAATTAIVGGIAGLATLGWAWMKMNDTPARLSDQGWRVLPVVAARAGDTGPGVRVRYGW